LALPGSHVAPLQQPLHEVPSHTHEPLTHRWPVEHCAPPPHVHVPELEQPSAVIPHDVQDEPAVPHAPAVVGVVQTFEPVQQPFGHDAALQTQAPFWHTSPALQVAPVPQ
jgi:hypothetical protein